MKLVTSTALLWSIALAVAATAQDTYTLRYKFDKTPLPRILTYKINMDLNGTMTGMMGSEEEQPMKMTQNMLMKHKVTGVKDGVATIISSFKDMKFSMDVNGMDVGSQAEAMADGIEKMTLTSHVNSRGETLDTSVEGIPEGMRQMSMGGGGTAFSLLSMMPAFPTDPIAVGGTWDSTVDYPGSAMIASAKAKLKMPKAKVKATLVGLETYKGIPAYKLELTYDVPMDMDMGQMFAEQPGAEGMTMKMKGKTTIKATAYLDRGTCFVLNMKQDLDSMTNMSIGGTPAGDMEMKMASKSKILLEQVTDEKATAEPAKTGG